MTDTTRETMRTILHRYVRWVSPSEMGEVEQALAEAGLIVVSRALAQHAKFDPKVLHREGLFDDALALQSDLAVRQPEVTA